MNNYLLISADSEDLGGGRIRALDIARQRLAKRKWPIYKRTRHKHALKCGDRVFIYIGGEGPLRQCIIGCAVISSLIKSPQKVGPIDDEHWLTRFPDSALDLSSIKIFSRPVPFKEILEKLDCCPTNPLRWGIVVHGGVRRMTDHDSQYVMKSSAPKKLSQ